MAHSTIYKCDSGFRANLSENLRPQQIAHPGLVPFPKAHLATGSEPNHVSPSVNLTSCVCQRTDIRRPCICNLVSDTCNTRKGEKNPMGVTQPGAADGKSSPTK